MNFREVSATVFAAIVIVVAFWATMGPPPREEQISMTGKRDVERQFAP
jgi:hypothetical protein